GAEIGLSGVAGNGFTVVFVGVLGAAVIYGMVSGKLAAHFGVMRGLVGHQRALSASIFHNDWAQILGGDVRDMERARFSIAFNERENSLLWCGFTKRAVL